MAVYEARETRFGGFYEDYAVGDVYRHWPGKTITEAENHLFCLLTLAASPIHIDHHYASSGQGEYDGPVVVGTFVYALLLGMSVPDISGRALANLGVKDLEHVAPVFPGDTLYGESEILDKRSSRSRRNSGIVTAHTTGRNQEEVIVAKFTRSVLLPGRPE